MIINFTFTTSLTSESFLLTLHLECQRMKISLMDKDVRQNSPTFLSEKKNEKCTQLVTIISAIVQGKRLLKILNKSKLSHFFFSLSLSLSIYSFLHFQLLSFWRRDFLPVNFYRFSTFSGRQPWLKFWGTILLGCIAWYLCALKTIQFCFLPRCHFLSRKFQRKRESRKILFHFYHLLRQRFPALFMLSTLDHYVSLTFIFLFNI